MSKRKDIPVITVFFAGLTIIALTMTFVGFMFPRIVIGIIGIVLTVASIGLLWFFNKKAVEKKRAQSKISNFSNEQKEKGTQKQEISTEKRTESLRKIIKSYTKIPLESMAQLLEFNDTIELQKWIMDLPDDLALTIDGANVLIPATLKNDQSISKMTDNIASYFHTCYYCAEPLEEGIETCPQCNKEVMKCVVCKLNINFGDAVGKCSMCEAVGHLSHIQEWLKVNGKCPHCQQQLPPEGIVILEPQEAKKKK